MRAYARGSGGAAAIGILVAALTIAAAGRAGTAGAEPGALLPDLVTLRLGPHDLRATVESGRPLLRLANEIANRGSGPLEIVPSAASTNCDGDGDPLNDRTATQRVFADTNASGAFERDLDAIARERAFGCIRFHPTHDHWHVLESAEYELRTIPAGELATQARKVGFCLGDNRLALPGIGVPALAVYPFGSQSATACDAAATQGLSVGWADLYAPHLPGQQLALRGLDRGRYCLIARADPSHLIEEVDEHNNVTRTPVALRPGAPAVRRLPGGCRR